MKIDVMVGAERAMLITNPSEFQVVREMLIANGTSPDAITISAPSLKAWAFAQVSVFAEAYRARLASTSAGKLAEYRIKEEIGRSPETADPEELALLSREAAARGKDQTALLADIVRQTHAFRRIALLIGVIEAEANAAVAGIADDAPDVIAQVTASLATAQAEAESEFRKARDLIGGD